MSNSQKKKLIHIIILLALFVIVTTLSLVYGGLEKLLPDNPLNWLIPFSVYLFIFLLGSYDILYRAFKNIIRGQIFDENFLMCVAAIGAFAIQEYLEAIAVVLFYQVGEWFQNYALNKSRKSIATLMDIRPDYANLLLEDGSSKVVDPEEIKVNDLILVKPGEKIPLDGVVVMGSTTIDARALTGESLPQEVSINNNVISGTINLTSTITVKVAREFHDSTVSKILDLVENASTQKSRSENFITRFSRWYTPTVVLSALLLGVIAGSITGDWNTWIYRALSFLVVSCPCALVISVPLTFFAGIGASSRYGILIKGSNYLEQLNKANIFVFDKTGTLTKGNFEVVGVYPEDRREEILYLASIAEYGSNHPIALSIAKAYGKNVNVGYSIKDVSGKGIIATKDDEIIYCGNEKLMKEYSIDFVETNAIGTIIYLASNDEFIGSIVVADEVKEESKEAIEYLNKIGARTIMLTGDNEKIASHVAHSLGIKEYKASLLPQNKVEELNAIIANKSKKDVLCFVGDGINDAPSIMKADVGIAMGGVGSDAAIEASDIVLMRDNLTSLGTAKKIAKKTIKIVKENIVFALLIKLMILILCSLGIVGMWLAVFGDVGVAILAILNAMRANSNYEEKTH
jgi:Cd2+/Zn2+-exporting ATPase